MTRPDLVVLAVDAEWPDTEEDCRVTFSWFSNCLARFVLTTSRAVWVWVSSKLADLGSDLIKQSKYMQI